jgi:hypothetical protein
VNHTSPEVITNAKTLEKVWKAWGIKDKLPDVDFSKEIVLVATTTGSRLNLRPVIDDKGDLKALGLGTSDLRPGFRYVIVVVSREGVKTVNGKEVHFGCVQRSHQLPGPPSWLTRPLPTHAQDRRHHNHSPTARPSATLSTGARGLRRPPGGHRSIGLTSPKP